MSRATLGIVGAGVMGAFHARSVTRAISTELVAVADVRPGVADALAGQLGCEATTDVEAMLSRRDLDGVVIATPVDTHLALVECAARAGLGVLCEKPLAPTIAGCARATAIARESDVPLQVGFHRRFDPDWRRLHEAVAGGELGRLYTLRSTLRDMTPPSPEYIRASGGYFADAFIHDFDAARWLGGDIDTVTAVGASLSGTFHAAGDFDNAVVVLGFASGAIGVLDGSRLGGYGYECSTELLGEHETLRVEGPATSNVRRLRDGTVQADLPTTFLERFAAAYLAEIEAFGETLMSRRAPAVGGWDALMALALAEAARLSASRGESVRLSDVLEAAGVSFGGRA